MNGVLFNPYDLYTPRHTSLALSASLIVHSVLFTIGWSVSKKETPPQLEKTRLSIILVNKKTERAPKVARSLGQHNLDGGGQPDKNNHQARAMLEAAPIPNQQIAPLAAQESVSQPAPMVPDQAYLTRPDKPNQNPIQSATPSTTPPQPLPPTPPAVMSPQPISTLQIAGKLSPLPDNAQSGHNNSKVLGASTVEYRFASYFTGLRSRLERIGTEHYRSVMAGHKLSSTKRVLLRLQIRADGQLQSVKILNSSGDKKIDQIMIDTAYRANPYPPFPDALRAEFPSWSITREWKIGKSSQVLAEDN